MNVIRSSGGFTQVLDTAVWMMRCRAPRARMSRDSSNGVRIDQVRIFPTRANEHRRSRTKHPTVAFTAADAQSVTTRETADGTRGTEKSMRPDAYPDGARIERIDANKNRITLYYPELEYTVTLTGHVHRPGPYQWRAGMRLTVFSWVRA